MTNLEIMEKAASFTTGAYMNAYYKEVSSGNITYGDLESLAIKYSGNAIIKTLYSPNGMCSDYTRQDNLRFDMAGIGADGIKNELLKNVVNVAVYHKMNDDRASNVLGDVYSSTFTDDQTAVMVFNSMVNNGVESGYKQLENPEVLGSVARVFAHYRREGKKETLDNIATTNNAAIYLNNELDTYYAKYGRSNGTYEDDGSYGGK